MSKKSRKHKNPVWGPDMMARDNARAIFNRTIRPLIQSGKAAPGEYVFKHGHWERVIG